MKPAKAGVAGRAPRKLDTVKTARKPVPPPASAYFFEERHDRPESHTLSVVVDNEPGVLARVIGLFSGRGYNIDSLTVSETEHSKHLSRITVVTTGTPMVLTQIKHQLERLVPVHSVTDLTAAGRRARARAGAGQGRRDRARSASRRSGSPTRSAPRSSTRPTDHFVFEITGAHSKIEQFIAIMAPLGLVEVCRTGVAAISRGAAAM